MTVHASIDGRAPGMAIQDDSAGLRPVTVLQPPMSYNKLMTHETIAKTGYRICACP